MSLFAESFLSKPHRQCHCAEGHEWCPMHGICWYKCDECCGTGRDAFDRPCAYCNGKGKVDKDGEAIE